VSRSQKIARKQRIAANHTFDALMVSLLFGGFLYGGSGIVTWHAGDSFLSVHMQSIAIFIGSLGFSLSLMLLQSLAHASRSLGLRYARCWLPTIAFSVIAIWIDLNAAVWCLLVIGCMCFGYVDTLAINRRVFGKLQA
jgi:hypothetical protein